MNIRPMTDVEKHSAAKAFVETWLGCVQYVVG